MNVRYLSPLIFCIAVTIMPLVSYGQETADHQAIRALLNDDQEAWIRGDGEAVLSNRVAEYITCKIPRNNGAADFHGVTVSDMGKMKKRLNDPDWTGSSKAFKDTVLDTKANWNMARIDVKGNDAVAISRIEWSQNDTTKNVRVRGGWESLWFLRKIDGNWKFVSAVGFFNDWEEDE